MTRSLILGTASVLAALAMLGACGDDDGGGSDATGPNQVTIEDFSFQPERIEVDAGTEVTWTNEDDFAHTVTARDDAFESGELEGGDQFRQTFDEPSEFAYFCSIHNSMTGTVIVK